MPKIIFFLPCEKILTDEGGTITLISILQDLNIEIPANAEIPVNAVIPREWQIISLTRPSGRNDIGTKLIHHLEIVKPDGELMGVAAKTSFVYEDKPHRMVVRVNGIPVNAQGRMALRLWIYPEGQDKSEHPLAEYDELSIVHKRVEQAQ